MGRGRLLLGSRWGGGGRLAAMVVTGRVCWLGRVRFRGRPVNKIIGKNHITRVLFAASSEMQVA